MSRRFSLIAALAILLALTVGCTNKKSVNPLANVGTKQPDKVLFDKAMDAMKHNRFDVARMTLQTLIITYPDSEYIARAKLAVGDSWYAEGGTASLEQAEQEYRDFETFFPNMPEAAEAQLKIANIQYQQMEKSDRDYTHAKRAEDEYRNLIMQYPDNPKLVKEGKERLLEVQEVLADREFEIGKFYYDRGSYPASIARLQSLVDKYPLYSKADEALFLIGQNREAEIAQLRSRPACQGLNIPPGCVGEAAKGSFIAGWTKDASTAYSQIITRYPLMEREDDAKKRLAALHQPIPRPTKAAVAQNKADAALSWEGLRAQWKGQGLEFDYLIGRNFSKLPANTFVMRRSDFEDASKKDLYTRYLRGWAMGLEFGHLNPRAATHLTMQQFPGLASQMKPPVAVESMMQLANVFRGDFANRKGWGWHDEAAWNLFFKTIKDIGQTTQDIKAADVVKNDYVAGANNFDKAKLKADADGYKLPDDYASIDVEAIRKGL